MRYLAALLPLLLGALGVAAVILGGMDDSPGAQLIGLAVISGAALLVVCRARRSRAERP